MALNRRKIIDEHLHSIGATINRLHKAERKSTEGKSRAEFNQLLAHCHEDRFMWEARFLLTYSVSDPMRKRVLEIGYCSKIIPHVTGFDYSAWLADANELNKVAADLYKDFDFPIRSVPLFDDVLCAIQFTSELRINDALRLKDGDHYKRRPSATKPLEKMFSKEQWIKYIRMQRRACSIWKCPPGKMDSILHMRAQYPSFKPNKKQHTEH